MLLFKKIVISKRNNSFYASEILRKAITNCMKKRLDDLKKKIRGNIKILPSKLKWRHSFIGTFAESCLIKKK
jgi:hypothetical protein